MIRFTSEIEQARGHMEVSGKVPFVYQSAPVIPCEEKVFRYPFNLLPNHLQKGAVSIRDM